MIRGLPQFAHRPGFTFLETTLTLFVVSIIILIFGSLISAREINRRTSFRVQAAALADEQLNALRRLTFSSLATQTNAAFRNILYNGGVWSVVADVSAGHSAPNALALAKNTNMTNTVSGRLLWPEGVYSTATLEAKWKAANDSPANWGLGYLFHAADAANGYRLRLGATGTDFDTSTGGNQNVMLEKIVSGTVTKVFSAVSTMAISPDTWYTLQVVLDPAGAATVKIYINGNQQDTSNINDTTFTSGPAALLGWAGVHAFVDDAQSIVNSVTSTWNFDSTTDLPAAWVRLSVNALPDGTPNTFDDNGLLTISAYPNVSSTTLKEAVITIQWQQSEQTRNYSTRSLIGQAALGL